MNHKDERVRKLWDRGIRDPRIIAHKIGFHGEATNQGIQRVKEAFERLGLVQKGDSI